MDNRINLLCCVIFGLYLVSVEGFEEKKVVCYHGTWATYRHGKGRFGVEDIDPTLCTHLMYAFFGISSDGRVKILDSYLDLEENWGRGNIKKFNQLKYRNPYLKTLAAIGGWNEGSKTFSLVANDPQLRTTFAKDVTKFAIDHGFDGIDLDWEYPAQLGGDALNDKNSYTLLLKEMRSELSKNNLLLSAAVASAEFSASLSYDIPQVVKYLDFINIMTYDFHGAWDPFIGINSPLYSGLADQTENQKQLNVNASINYWINNGAPREKIVMGIPFYGRSFSLRSLNLIEPGSPHNGPGLGGPYTGEPGNIGFNELCELQLSSRWTRNWDVKQCVPYIHRNYDWIGYDDIESVTLKVDFINEMNLGGAMVWAIETDDFHGICGYGVYPLLNLINRNLGLEPDKITTTTSTEIPATSEFTTNSPPDEWDTTTPSKETNSPNSPDTTTTSFPSIPTTVSPKPFKCVTDGTFRDPVDCSVYYVCIHSHQYRFQCPYTLKFDTRILTCNWPHLVDCSTSN